MLISKLKVKIEETKRVNLKEINLTKKPLGSTVALVGKNGAGKSRILKFVESYVNSINAENYFEDHFQNIPSSIISQFSQNIQNAKNQIAQIKNKNLNPSQIKQIKLQANQSISPFLQRFQQLGQAYVKIVDNDDLQNIKASINNNSLTFEQILTNSHFDNIVANPNIIQQAKINPSQRNNVLLNEFTALNNQSTVNYLTKITNEIVTDEFNLYVKHREKPELISTEIKNKKSFQLFSKFQVYVPVSYTHLRAHETN
jgi:dephospho-CoA kinase